MRPWSALRSVLCRLGDQSCTATAGNSPGITDGASATVVASERAVSQTDLVRLRGSDLPWTGWHGLMVRDLMTKPAKTIAGSAPLDEAARRMTAEHVHRLVVVDNRRAPIGVISESDIVREIADCCDDG